jgi:DNA-binding transcriptional ArsR family regulator
MIDCRLEQEINLLHGQVCYALADPKRILILYALADGPMCVSELVDMLDLPQSTVSRHLRVLRERGLTETERKGTAIYYALADKRVVQALDLLRSILATQLAASAELSHSINESNTSPSATLSLNSQP